jgi:hypothetical protein
VTTFEFAATSEWRFVQPSPMRASKDARAATREGQVARPRWCITRSGAPPPYYTLCRSQRFALASDLVRSINSSTICFACITEARKRPDCPITFNQQGVTT